MKNDRQFVLLICLGLSLSSLTYAQSNQWKQYDGKYFSFRYPKNWGLVEVSEGDIKIGEDNSQNPVDTIEIAVGPGAVDQTQASKMINAHLSAFAAANHLQLTYKEHGRTEDNRLEVISSLHSDTENMDVLSSVTLANGQFFELMSQPRKFDQAMAIARPILQTVQWKFVGISRTGSAQDEWKSYVTWKTYSDDYFSFDYPSNWTISDDSGAGEHAINAGTSEGNWVLGIKFIKGFKDTTKSGSSTQCVDVDDYLMKTYREIEKTYPTGQSTLVTGPTPGYLGGRTMRMTVRNPQTGGTQDFWFNSIPMKKGLYTVVIFTPAQVGMADWIALRKRFGNSIKLKSEKSEGYCNSFSRIR